MLRRLSFLTPLQQREIQERAALRVHFITPLETLCSEFHLFMVEHDQFGPTRVHDGQFGWILCRTPRFIVLADGSVYALGRPAKKVPAHLAYISKHHWHEIIDWIATYLREEGLDWPKLAEYAANRPTRQPSSGTNTQDRTATAAEKDTTFVQLTARQLAADWQRLTHATKN